VSTRVSVSGPPARIAPSLKSNGKGAGVVGLGGRLADLLEVGALVVGVGVVVGRVGSVAVGLGGRVSVEEGPEKNFWGN
jgi:hypothetical protein